jgi:hypothetical protein
MVVLFLLARRPLIPTSTKEREALPEKRGTPSET